MANFKVHFNTATIASASVAATLLSMKVIEPTQAVYGFLIGSLSGLMPDVDSAYSTSIKIAFTVLSLLASILLVLAKIGEYSLIEIGFSVIMLYGFIQWVVIDQFRKIVVHRGMFHSIPSAFLFGLLMTNFCYQVFNTSAFISWLYGFFATFGYLIHLILDEMYSVDLRNQRIKRSFGTALKFYRVKTAWNQLHTAIIYILLVVCFYYSPDHHVFVQKILSEQAWNQFLHVLMPYQWRT